MLILVLLWIVAILGETRFVKEAGWRRFSGPVLYPMLAALVPIWLWLLVAVMVLHHVGDRHAEAAGWLLLATLVPIAGALFAGANRNSDSQWLPMTLLAVLLTAFVVGASTTGESGSPEELHHDDHGHIEVVDHPGEAIPHGR